MKIQSFLLWASFACVAVFQSCTIATTIHFNRDFSGNYTLVMDMSEFISMAAMFDTTDNTQGQQDEAIAEMRHAIDSMGVQDIYQGISGVHNAKVDLSDDGVLTIAFDFDNVQSLHAASSALEEKSAEGMSADMPMDLFGGSVQSFTQRGKTIIHTSESTGGGLETEGLEFQDDDGEMDFIAQMIDYTLEFTFDRRIRSVSADGITILQEGRNSVKTRVDAGKMLKDGKYSISITTR